MRIISEIRSARPSKHCVLSLALAFTLPFLTTARAACAAAQNPPPQSASNTNPTDQAPGRISGHVYRSDDGSPISKAIVTLVKGNATDRQERSTRTDASGAYSFDDVAPSTYEVRAVKPGFISNYHRADPDDPPTQSLFQIVTPKPGQRLDKVDLHLEEAGTISGRVVDEDGDPAVGVSVVAIHPQYESNGRVNTSESATPTSDDRGEYRLTGLRTGQYIVRAGEPEESGGAARHGDSWAYLPSYYPNATRLAAAERVKVTAGAQTPQINLRVISASRNTYVIHGTAPGVALQTGWALSGIRVILADGSEDRDVSGGRDWINGSFTINGLAPGQYTIACTAIRQKAPGSNITSEDLLIAISHATIVDRDVTISMQFGKPGVITGQLKIDMPHGTTVTDFRGWTVDPQREFGAPISEDQFSNPDSQADLDGRFGIQGLDPGKYWLDIKDDESFYVKQVVCLGTDFTLRPIEIEIDSAFDCQVALRTDPATITGQVMNGDKAAPGYEVIAVPEQTEARSSVYFGGEDLADGAGRFTISELAPGDYLLFAVRRDPEHSYYAPDFVDRNLGAAVRVTVKPNETKSISLTPITPQ